MKCRDEVYSLLNTNGKEVVHINLKQRGHVLAHRGSDRLLAIHYTTTGNARDIFRIIVQIHALRMLEGVVIV